MEKVVSRGNMMAAYWRVVSNKGAPDMDGMPVSALKGTCVRNPIFLDRHSGFNWTVIPILSGQCFSGSLPAVVAV
jgi:hypothetical protein